MTPINSPGTHTFAVCQKARKLDKAYKETKGDTCKDEYHSCHMILVRLHNDNNIQSGLTYVKGAVGNCQRDASFEVEIRDMGTYALFVQMEWKKIPN